MLVLSRFPNESILLTGGIKITLVEIRNGKIRLGIDAPPTVEVWREELVNDEMRKALGSRTEEERERAIPTLDRKV